MEVHLTTVIAIIISFAILIVIVVGTITKFFLYNTRAQISNSDIEKKLDRIMELLENREKRD